VDLKRLTENVRTARSIGASMRDSLAYLRWLYTARLPRALRRSGGRPIDFDLAAQVGRLRLHVRDNRGSDAFIFSEVFQHRYYDVPLPFTPRTVLDIGANAGYSAVFFARAHPGAAIACVEPMPDNLRVLGRNLEANGVAATIVPAAIGAGDGHLRMVVADRDYGHKVADITFGRPMDGRAIEVEAVSVPTLLDRLGWERVDLLKVDVEGYEAILLTENADWLSRVDAMCIECHEGFELADLQAVADRWGLGRVRQERGTLLLVRPDRAAAAEAPMEVAGQVRS
jgi:FkbM family methyltransferase